MKIGIIKLGALGDVVRTLCVLPAIKEKFPNSEITWITKENAKELFEGNDSVNRVLTIPLEENFLHFDILYNFDVEEEAIKLANNITAKEKFGFYSEEGFVKAFNESGEYYLNTMFDDELKKNNPKTYQEMIFGVAELEWKKQRSEIFLNEAEKNYARDFVEKNSLRGKKIFGIHMGASSRWPSKVWHKDNLKDFIKKIKIMGFEVILFAGPNEIEEHKNLICDLNKKGINVFSNNPHNSLKEFCSLVNICDKILCGDSFALHIALAFRKPLIGLFFCTSPWEVEDYGLLKKVVSKKLFEIFPEKSDLYFEEIVKSISAEEVLKNLSE